MDIKEVSLIANQEVKRHPWELARLEIIQRFFNKFDSYLNDQKGNILDVGCGDAFVTQEMARRYPNIKFVGVDQSLDSRMIQKIRVKPSLSNFRGSENSRFLKVIEHIFL